MSDSSVLSSMREELRLRHYSPETERAYVGWVVRYVKFHGLRHPLELTRADLLNFLATLAVEHGVSASTQNQALAAVNFLYREVLHRPLDLVEGIVRAKRPARLPVVMTKAEVRLVLGSMRGAHRLVATLLYGRVSGFSNVFISEPRTSIWDRTRSSCGAERAARTESRCCRSRPTARWELTWRG